MTKTEQLKHTNEFVKANLSFDLIELLQDIAYN
jgi:hypothetical protein